MTSLHPQAGRSLQAAFARDGYVIVHDHLRKNELDAFRAAYSNLAALYLRRAGLSQWGTVLDLEAAGHEHVAEFYDASAMMPEFVCIAAKRETASVVNTLMGKRTHDPLYMSANRVLIAMPNDESHTYGWHQEVFYTVPGSKVIQTWAPITADTSASNGTIEVLVGSHREGAAPADWREEDGRSLQVIVKPETVAKYEARTIPMRLGQMLFFDSRLIHRSGHNTSPNVRYSLVGLYHDPSVPDFRAPQIKYAYRGPTPRESWEETTRR